MTIYKRTGMSGFGDLSSLTFSWITSIDWTKLSVTTSSTPTVNYVDKNGKTWIESTNAKSPYNLPIVVDPTGAQITLDTNRFKIVDGGENPLINSKYKYAHGNLGDSQKSIGILDTKTNEIIAYSWIPKSAISFQGNDHTYYDYTFSPYYDPPTMALVPQSRTVLQQYNNDGDLINVGSYIYSQAPIDFSTSNRHNTWYINYNDVGFLNAHAMQISGLTGGFFLKTDDLKNPSAGWSPSEIRGEQFGMDGGLGILGSVLTVASFIPGMQFLTPIAMGVNAVNAVQQGDLTSLALVAVNASGIAKTAAAAVLPSGSSNLVVNATAAAGTSLVAGGNPLIAAVTSGAGSFVGDYVTSSFSNLDNAGTSAYGQINSTTGNVTMSDYSSDFLPGGGFNPDTASYANSDWGTDLSSWWPTDFSESYTTTGLGPTFQSDSIFGVPQSQTYADLMTPTVLNDPSWGTGGELITSTPFGTEINDFSTSITGAPDNVKPGSWGLFAGAVAKDLTGILVQYALNPTTGKLQKQPYRTTTNQTSQQSSQTQQTSGNNAPGSIAALAKTYGLPLLAIGALLISR